MPGNNIGETRQTVLKILGFESRALQLELFQAGECGFPFKKNLSGCYSGHDSKRLGVNMCNAGEDVEQPGGFLGWDI